MTDADDAWNPVADEARAPQNRESAPAIQQAPTLALT